MNKLLLVMQYFGIVLGAVMQVEQTVGSEMPGTAKAKVVLDAIQAAATIAQQTIPDAHVQYITGLINTIVGSLNASGVFQHKTPAPTVPSTTTVIVTG